MVAAAQFNGYISKYVTSLNSWIYSPIGNWTGVAMDGTGVYMVGIQANYKCALKICHYNSSMGPPGFIYLSSSGYNRLAL